MGPLLQAILDRCKREGVTRPDLEAADIVIALIRFSRPALTWLPPDEERSLARRHLDVYIAGLATSRGTTPKPSRPGRLKREPRS